MQKSKSRNILAHTAIGVGGDLGAYFLAFLSSIIIARVLGPELRGSYAVITLINVYLANVFIFGASSVSEIKLAKKDNTLAEVHSFALLFSFGIGCLCALLFWFVKPWLFTSFLKEVNPFYCLIAVLLVPLAIYSTISRRIMVGLGQIPTLNAIKITRSTLELLGPVLFMLVIPMSLKGAIVAWVFAIVLTCAAQAWWLLKESRWQFRINIQTAREFMFFGAKIHFAFVPAVTIGQMDIFMLNHYRGPAEVGLYAVAYGLMLKIIFSFGALLNATQARIIGDSQEESEKLVRRLVRHGVFIAVILTLILSLAGRTRTFSLLTPPPLNSVIFTSSLSSSNKSWVNRS